MIIEAIAAIILIGSLTGLSVILLRKIPLLVELPCQKTTVTEILLNLKAKIKIISPLKRFSFEIFLQKILLKAEQKSNHWLRQIKEKAENKKYHLSDNYWQELKDPIDIPIEPIKPKRGQRVIIRKNKTASKKAKAKPDEKTETND